ncbi:MAG: hypothetical protein ICV73_25345 [Acetobacteraceae bacterium]|nr:hypothetical protein [Acetobacteraceae bacterium]
MRRTSWARTLRSVAAVAALGAVLGGCAGEARPAQRYYGGGYYGGPPGYYGSPYYGYGPYGGGGYDRFYGGPRGYYGGGGRPYDRPAPRTENWSQERLRQHWLEQSRRVQ